MALVPLHVHRKTGQLAVLAAALATALVTSARRRPRAAGSAPPEAPPAPPRLRAHVVPTHHTPADPRHAAAVTDLCTRVSELASDLAKRHGGEQV
ncbi:hypothetical protein AB0J38_04725 [Streptomyces sp. NPDC050095]|uniref:hypothetical protein n=1 Tax=unclassified Streptomyces TaxID=2593676 RepID=UPI003424C6BE